MSARVSSQVVHLRGNVGQKLNYVLRARPRRKPPASARASSDQPWLSVASTKIDRSTTVIELVVPQVPNLPGITLSATVNLIVDDDHQVAVPVKLVIAGDSRRRG